MDESGGEWLGDLARELFVGRKRGEVERREKEEASTN
jgi:hypothetical protein